MKKWIDNVAHCTRSPDDCALLARFFNQEVGLAWLICISGSSVYWEVCGNCLDTLSTEADNTFYKSQMDAALNMKEPRQDSLKERGIVQTEKGVKISRAESVRWLESNPIQTTAEFLCVCVPVCACVCACVCVCVCAWTHMNDDVMTC